MDISQGRGLPGLDYPEEYLRRLAPDLSLTFAGTFNSETVERYVLESYTARVEALLASLDVIPA